MTITSVGDSSSTVDDDAASYVKADKSGAGGANSTGRPATNPSVTKPDDGTTPGSEGTKSVPAPLNYSKVSPVGYEHGEPVGTYDRIVFATPALAVSTEATPRTNPEDVPTWPPIPTSPGSVLPSFIQGIPITHGILVETDSAPGPGQDPRGPEEPPPSGPVTRDELPVGGLIEPQAVRLPQVISIVFNPDGWTSAAGDALRLLDEWATDAADPGAGWDRVYFWGAATAAVVLGIELTRRYRFTVRPAEWDDRTPLVR
jgi:hypothetical protein